MAFEYFFYSNNDFFSSDHSITEYMAIGTATVTVSLIVVWVFTIVFIFFMSVIVNIFSYVLSNLLNRASQLQILRSGLGGDFLGQVSFASHVKPNWIPGESVYLPEALSGEIAVVSDRAAAESVAKFRKALGQLALVEGQRDISEVMGDYLTWKELIHTTYFHVPRFRKLVAYAISQCEGFRATEAFKSDPDYPVVAGWYDELMREDAT